MDGTRSTLREEFVVEREKTRELWGKALRQTASCRLPTVCLKVLVGAARKQRRIDRQVTRINAELNRGRVSGDGNEAAAMRKEGVLAMKEVAGLEDLPGHIQAAARLIGRE